jgi:hypothetical protein
MSCSSKKAGADLFSLVESTVMGVSAEESEKMPAARGGKLRGPLPLLPGSFKLPVPMTKELFLKGLEPMLKMSTSCNLETRLEAAKMLCDLAESSDKSFVLLSECQDLVYQTLEFLLNASPADSLFEEEIEFDDVKQLAIMAFGMFAEIDVYQECFLHLKNFNQIIQLINNSPREIPSYATIQMRRQAAKGFGLLVKNLNKNEKTCKTAKLFLSKQLESHGFATEESWKCHCDQLLDQKMKKLSLEIGGCFH